MTRRKRHWLCYVFHKWQYTTEGSVYVKTCARCGKTKRHMEQNKLKRGLMETSTETLQRELLVTQKLLIDYNRAHPFSDFRLPEHQRKNVILTLLVALNNEFRRRGVEEEK